jgi:hypothetical protein
MAFSCPALQPVVTVDINMYSFVAQAWHQLEQGKARLLKLLHATHASVMIDLPFAMLGPHWQRDRQVGWSTSDS